MSKQTPDQPMPKSPAPTSPASTLPMFRDELDDAADADAPPSNVTPISQATARRWAQTPPVPVMPVPTAEPTSGNNQLRPPAKPTPVPSVRDENDPIVKLARMTRTELATPLQPADDARAMGRKAKPGPRITQAGPVVRVPPETIERTTQIGSVVKTEKVLRRELEREAFKRPTEPTLPTLDRVDRKSEPMLRPPTLGSDPALRPPAPASDRRSEPALPALRPPADRRSEPALPVERRIPQTPRPDEIGARAVAVESPDDAPIAADPAPVLPPEPAKPAPSDSPLPIERSWGGRVLVPDLDKHGFSKPSRAAPVPAPRALKQRSAGESLARLFYFAAGGLLVAAVAVYGGRFWRETHPRVEPPPVHPPAPVPSAALASVDGRFELAPDRHGVTRFASGKERWGAPLPTALDSLELTGPLVLGHAADTIIALDAESGRTRFTWVPPTGERWAPQHPAVIDDCLVAVTTRDHKTIARCLDLATGQQRWAASLNGDHDCMQAPAGVPGAVIMPCSGWTAVIDDRSGASTPITGGVGLVGDQPATLLRAAGGKLTTQPWSEAKRRFTQTGDVPYGPASVPIASAVLHRDRLVLRAVETSDELAVIAPRDGAQFHVSSPAFRLADATPLTRRCGGETSPKLQLLELTPRVGASFDPASAGERALALLDVELGYLAWTSHKATGLHGARAASPPICRGGHYFLPLDITDRAGKPTSVLWIVDAETGKTAAVLAFDAELGAAMSDLSADQIDDDRLVGVGARGVFELAWRKPEAGLHDARAELEAVLGPLP